LQFGVHHVQIFTKFAVWTLIFRCHAGVINCCLTDGVTAGIFSLISLTNSNNSPTRCNNFSSFLSWPLFTAQHDSGVFPPIIRSSMTAVAVSGFYLSIVMTVVLCSCSGRPARPRTQHDYHHDTKVKPEAATAVIELLMMGGKTPETCWVVNKRQDNKLENCCIWLMIYLNCTMMHGLKNLKSLTK
jgi:hypothetical protein